MTSFGIQSHVTFTQHNSETLLLNSSLAKEQVTEITCNTSWTELVGLRSPSPPPLPTLSITSGFLDSLLIPFYTPDGERHLRRTQPNDMVKARTQTSQPRVHPTYN